MKKFTYILTFILLGMNLTAQSVWNGKREAITKGSGTETDPYLIENAQNLAWLVYLINYDYAEWTEGKYFKLTTDIDLNGDADNQWIPIAAGLSMTGGNKLFGGTLDGNYHKITGLYIDENSEINNEKSLWYESEAAFFSCMPENSLIKNLHIEGYINIDDKECAGFSAMGGNLENCVSNVDIESTICAAGLMVRANSIKNSVNLGDIKGDLLVGGIAAYCLESIENCYNVGNLTGGELVGGVVGYLIKASAIMKNCYNVGNINTSEETEFMGGLVGKTKSDTSIENCYYLETCIESSNEYGEAETAEFMRSHEFVTLLNNNTNVWQYDAQNSNNGFPILNNYFPLNINQPYEEETVLVFPNPTSDYIKISGDIVSYEIFDILGKNVVNSRKASGKTESVSVADFTSGLYFVKCLLEDGKVVTKKIIVK